MRKLNKKNKTYIIILSLLVVLVLGAILVFIFYKFKDLNTTYDIAPGSIVYNSKDEIVKISSDTYAKKDLLGRYYIMVGSEKVYVGGTPVIFNEDTKEVILLGTFYEVLRNGEINKLKGQTTINSTASSRIFKIDDRKYLVVAPTIRSEDGSLNATDYLLINIDKIGNGYLYNNEVNIKTFSDLSLITDAFTFNVNEELLIIENETIDLAKINGSTNEYVKPEDTPLGGGSGSGDSEGDGSGTGAEDGEGTGSGSGGGGGGGGGGGSGSGTGTGTGDGTGSGSGSGNGTGDGTGDGTDGDITTPEGGTDSIYPDDSVKPDPVIVDRYIYRKTTIMSVETTASKMTVNYLVYDPFSEYKSIYVDLYLKEELVGTYELDMALTKHVIEDLRANSEYRLDFYYTYEAEDGTTKNVLFDSMLSITKNINGKITLEKVSSNSVRYILKIDSGYVLDSANVAMYIDGELVVIDGVDVNAASSSEGFKSTITFEGSGNFGLLLLTDCIYNGAPLDIEASYKYKL